MFINYSNPSGNAERTERIARTGLLLSVQIRRFLKKSSVFMENGGKLCRYLHNSPSRKVLLCNSDYIFF